ncbi:unnamed protein product [Microthlaspi erraticum]|uniref:Retrotransposon gag domain-containing protein n=1 Tax=Microthlaspi erraticum TaxID=1685480 RepID=A0A6D2IJA6_9BRAS|nr:unnamed protein product [Microthlaspi erraticum]
MTRRSNKDNLVEHPDIDKLEKLIRKQKAQEMADEAARAHAAEVARANEEGRDPPPPPPNPQDPAGDVNVQPQAGVQTIGDYDSADAFFTDRNPIHPPLPARNDYEIKPQIIALVRQNQFNGLPAEHPLDHIENFEEICSTTRSNGVSADYLKCKLFSFSLGDKASRWLKSLPAHSITTWDEYKAAFINHFYTKQRSVSVRNKISNFRQANNESFYEALDRFKEYIRDCPNHGFNEGNLWNIFYRGIDHKYKLSLDTASNGNFMTKTVDEAKVLIENLAASDCNNCPDYDRSSRTTTSSPDSFQMTELKNMMAQVLKGQLKHINAIEGMSDANEDPSRECMGDFSNEANEEDVNYIGNYGNKGYNPSYRPNPNMSYRNLMSFGAFWSIWDMRSMEGLGTWSSSTGYAKEEGRSHLEDQLDPYSTNRSSSSTRPAKLQLDRAEKSTVKPEKCCFPLDFPLTLNLILFVYANSIESVYRGLGRARLYNG